MKVRCTSFTDHWFEPEWGSVHNGGLPPSNASVNALPFSCPPQYLLEIIPVSLKYNKHVSQLGVARRIIFFFAESIYTTILIVFMICSYNFKWEEEHVETSTKNDG